MSAELAIPKYGDKWRNNKTGEIMMISHVLRENLLSGEVKMAVNYTKFPTPYQLSALSNWSGMLTAFHNTFVGDDGKVESLFTLLTDEEFKQTQKKDIEN